MVQRWHQQAKRMNCMHKALKVDRWWSWPFAGKLMVWTLLKWCISKHVILLITDFIVFILSFIFNQCTFRGSEGAVHYFTERGKRSRVVRRGQKSQGYKPTICDEYCLRYTHTSMVSGEGLHCHLIGKSDDKLVGGKRSSSWFKGNSFLLKKSIRRKARMMQGIIKIHFKWEIHMRKSSKWVFV